jgi:hypothetical protein
LDGAKCAQTKANDKTAGVQQARKSAPSVCEYLEPAIREEVLSILRLKHEESLLILQKMNERVEAAERWVAIEVDIEEGLANEPPF